MNEKKEQEESANNNNHINNNANKFLDYENFSQFYDQFSSMIKDTVASSTKIPLKQNDIDFYSTSQPFKTFMQTQNERILKMMANLLKQQNIKKNNIYSTKLDDEERMDLLVDSNDQIIEKLGIQLDELQGLRKKTETELKFTSASLNLTTRNINTSWNKDVGMVVNKALLQTAMTSNQKPASNSSVNVLMDKAKGVTEKPQTLFDDKPDNSHLPFVPKIRFKPNCLQPLPEIFSRLNELDQEIDKDFFNTYVELFENPYAYEIDQVELNETDVNNLKIETPKSLDDTPFKYIDTLDDLRWLCDHLGKSNRSRIKEIAIDLEHHSYRSFLGFTCLMQISTRYDDFIVDTIKLRSEMHRLNEIFTDWTLVKVMHGADFDVEWLQKDFGLYIVNLFDTGQATRVLQYPHFSLSYLLQKFCNVQAQKQYQLADWRQRPLMDDMVKYAREDTHYLIYIYDNLRQELIKKDNQQQQQQNDLELMKLVHQKSQIICKKVFKKPVFISKGFLNLCQNNSHLNSKQMKALRDLYEWRDKIARESDESCEYVLKNHQLLKIAELLPREIYGILALCNPLSSLVQANVHEIHEIIKNAREFKGTFTSLDIENEKNSHLNNTLNTSTANLNTSVGAKPDSVLESIVHLTTYDPDHVLNNPHDFKHQDEPMNQEESNNPIQDLNSILIKPSVAANSSLPDSFVENTGSSLSELFHKDLNITNFTIREKIRKINQTIENPFSMYLPPELRHESDMISSASYWNLMKPTGASLNSTQQNGSLREEEPVRVEPDIIMIPLKKQVHLEKKSDKKKNKQLKNLEYEQAIQEYHRQQEEKEKGIGDETNEQQQQLNSLIESKILSNLKTLSAEAAATSTEATQPQFEYNMNEINRMFKPEDAKKNESDSAGRARKGNFNKVNKRRTTNAVTRSSNSKSVTFKMNQSN